MPLSPGTDFDVWRGRSPREDFGPLREVGPEFESHTEAVRRQVGETFGVQLAPGRDAANSLDQIIDSMWETGWSPNPTAAEPFVRDFGLVLASSLHRDLGGHVLSRGAEAYIHTSIWWIEKGVEAFPYHAVVKRLLTNDAGSPLAGFVRGVDGLLNRSDVETA